MGDLTAKVEKALASKAAVKAKFERLMWVEDEKLPEKLADWPKALDRLVGSFAGGTTTGLEDDRCGFITEYAFYGHNIKWVNAPGVRWVCDKAFANCSELEEVHLTGVTDLASNAFEGCTVLTTLELGPGIEEMSEKMFSGLRYLESVEGLGNVYYVNGARNSAEGTFSGCTSLQYLDFSSKLDGINDYMFYGCRSLQYPGDLSGIQSVGVHAFDGCRDLSAGLEQLPLCTSVYPYAFRGCENLEFLDGCLSLPSIEYIGGHAFEGCDRLSTLKLHRCPEIDENALAGSSVSEIHFKGTYQTRAEVESDPSYADRWGAGPDVTVKFDL